VALLPLGLPPNDPFWKDSASRWTSQLIWSGENIPADHAMHEESISELPRLKR
jgi:hypothetical protein